MTSEQIIQRLLDQKKISVKEAMIILKDLARIGIERTINYWPIEEPNKDPYRYPITVMYGVNTTGSPYWTDNQGTTISSSLD